MEKIAIGSDKAGFELKEHVKEHLINCGYEVVDVGTTDPENPVLYYETASRLAKLIQSGESKRGILCCGTGMGMSQIANKYKGVFAACCESVFAAFNCRSINNSNVLCMGGNILGPGNAIAMTDSFLQTEFTQGVPEERAAYLAGMRETVVALDSELFGMV